MAVTKKTGTTVCQGCCASIPDAEIYLLHKPEPTAHGFFACKKCTETEYQAFPAVLYQIESKINQTRESFVKNGLTKEGIKVKVGQLYPEQEIVGIKKIHQTFAYNLATQAIDFHDTYFVTFDKKTWLEI